MFFSKPSPPVEFYTLSLHDALPILASSDVSQQGLVKAGLKDRARDAVSVAASSFEEAVRHAVQDAARVFVGATQDLPQSPTETEQRPEPRGTPPLQMTKRSEEHTSE